MPLFRRTFLTPLLLFSCFILASGQDSTGIAKSVVGIGTGYAYSALKNEKFSPLTQSGAGLPIQVYFREWTPRHQWYVQVYYSSFSLSSDQKTFITREDNALLQYASHFRLGKEKRKITTWAGFVLDGQLVRRGFSSSFGNGTAANNSSAESFFSLNPSVLFEDAIGKDKLSLQVWASIAAFVILPEDGTGGTTGDFVSIGSFSKTEARLSYSKYFSRKWEGRIDGQFQFYAMSVSEHIYKVNTQMIASLAYKL